MSLADLAAWLRMGRPAPGRIAEHPSGTYTFEDGAEVPRRLEAEFGNLSSLVALDLGCGPSETAVGSQIFEISWNKLVSVEAFIPYVHKLQTKTAKAAQHEIIANRIESIFDEIRPGEADIALLIDVLEHFPRPAALRLLVRLERLVNRGVVIFVPLGRVEQEPFDQNALQRHHSFWEARDLAKLGYSVDVYRAFHGQLTPPADAAWAIKKKKLFA